VVGKCRVANDLETPGRGRGGGAVRLKFFFVHRWHGVIIEAPPGSRPAEGTQRRPVGALLGKN
jgi:hypothetical protein